MKRKKKAIAAIVTLLLIGVTFGILLSATPMVATGPSSMKGFWRLDTGIGSIAIDSSDAMNDGILSGGKFGNALEFDGVDDYVDVGDLSAIDGQSAITYEVWIYRTGGVRWDGIISRKPVPTNPGISIDFVLGGSLAGSDDVLARIGGGTGTNPYGYTKSNLITPNAWHHVVMVFDGIQTGNVNRLKIYIDGQQQTLTFSGTIPATSPVCSTSSTIGKYVDTAGTWPFEGRIDEARIYSRALSSTEVSEHNLGTFNDNTGLVGLWHFDESVGTIVNDDSGNNNHGTINGASWAGPTWVDGKYGKALHFDGEDDYVNIPDSPSLDITGDITMEAWFQINSFSTSEGYHLYIASKDSTSGRNYGIGVDLTWSNPYKPFFIIFDGSPYKVVWGSSTIVTDRWYHLAGVFDSTNSELMLYLDGILEGVVSTTTTSINAGPADLRIGAREYSGHQCFFNGIIDEVRIWDSALSSCEILLAMKGKMEILPEAGLVLYDSAIHDLSHGDTVTICIISDHPIDEIILNPNRPATPKKTEGWIDNIEYSADGYSVTFTVHQDEDKPCKTLHLWVYLDTGEHIGVNLHFAR